jgi:hypothetical protein
VSSGRTKQRCCCTATRCALLLSAVLQCWDQSWCARREAQPGGHSQLKPGQPLPAPDARGWHLEPARQGGAGVELPGSHPGAQLHYHEIMASTTQGDIGAGTQLMQQGSADRRRGTQPPLQLQVAATAAKQKSNNRAPGKGSAGSRNPPVRACGGHRGQPASAGRQQQHLPGCLEQEGKPHSIPQRG